MCIWLAVVLLGCTRTGGGLVGDDATEVARGEGWAVAVPTGSKVVATEYRLSVDAADGSRWFDVRWQPRPGVRPEQPLMDWARTECEPVMWDEFVTPRPTVVMSGGTCVIHRRNFWLIGTIQTIGDGVLVTTYLADADALAFEDAWVDYLRTASTLATDQPRPVDSPEALRQRIRDAGASAPPSSSPIPGGGVIFSVVGASLGDVWADRVAQPPPTRFASEPSAPPD